MKYFKQRKKLVLQMVYLTKEHEILEVWKAFIISPLFLFVFFFVHCNLLTLNEKDTPPSFTD